MDGNYFEKIRKSLSLAIAEGAFATVFLSLTTPFLVAFAVTLGANNFQLGLMVAFLALFSLLGQIPSALLVERKGRRKLIAVVSSAASKFSWLGIALIPLFFLQDWFFFLLLFVVVYAFFLSVMSPAWSSWMGDLVEVNSRGKYFGKRNYAMGLASLFSLLLGALFVAVFSRDPLWGFQLLFLIAIAFAVAAVLLVSSIYEPPAIKPLKWESLKTSFRALLRKRNFKWFVVFFLLWNFGLGISSPFWDAFILKNLAAEAYWVPLAAFSLGLGSVFSLKHWGPLADKYGNRAILIICAAGISFVPLAWLFVTRPWHAVAINLLAGVFWGGFTLSAFTYQLDIVPGERKPRFLALLGTIVGVPLVFAPAIGGMLAEFFSGAAFFFVEDLKFVFLLSAVFRFSSLLALKGIDEPRTRRVPSKIVFFEIVSGSLAYAHMNFQNIVVLKSRSAASLIYANLGRVILPEIRKLKGMRKRAMGLISLSGISRSRWELLRALYASINSELKKLAALERKIRLIERKSVFVEEETMRNIFRSALRERRAVAKIKSRLDRAVKGLKPGKSPAEHRKGKSLSGAIMRFFSD